MARMIATRMTTIRKELIRRMIVTTMLTKLTKNFITRTHSFKKKGIKRENG